MNLLNKIGLTFGALMIAGVSFAQAPPTADPATTAGGTEGVNATWKPSLVKDGVIDVVPHVNRSLEMTNIREIDAAFKRRVWRQIDIRQKQNQAFSYIGDEYSGGGAFIEIVLDAIKKGKVSAYSTFDDRFTEPLSMEALDQALAATIDSVPVTDAVTQETIYKVTKKEFDINSVTKYRLKEDWIFDRNLGRMVVRIIGISPLIDRYDENTGEYNYSAPMFWLHYPELRKILANYEVYNPQNDIHRMSWADFFDGRHFASYIIKTSANNPTGADIQRGLRGLEEGERAIEALREKEDDMWQR